MREVEGGARCVKWREWGQVREAESGARCMKWRVGPGA